MISVTPFEELGRFRNGWLDAHYHFSFADYHDPSKMGLGALRVWNDDTIAPHSGFDPHPHRDMEIVTYVRTGAISHRDSLGQAGVTRAGDVQVMTAGTGIVHSEMNEEDGPTTLFQIWIFTDRRGHSPGWETRQFPKEPVVGSLPVLASGRVGEDHALPINQNAAVLGGRIAVGKSVVHALGTGRGAYLVPTEGRVRVNGRAVETRGGVMVTDEEAITVEALEAVEVVLVDTPLQPGLRTTAVG